MFKRNRMGGDSVLDVKSCGKKIALAAATLALALSVAPATAKAIDQEVLDRHTVAGVSPAGSTINLFDYWASDNATPSDSVTGGLNAGINKNKLLKFRSSTQYGKNDDYGFANFWTGPSKGPLQGIVNKTLDEDGYPTLSGIATRETPISSSTQAGHTTTVPKDALLFKATKDGEAIGGGGESLQYLFDPSYSYEGYGRTAHTNVSNLLQVDRDGYYYYSAKQNFAEYNESTNSFVLYDKPAVNAGNTASKSRTGNFFPFAKGTDVFTAEDEKGNLTTDNTPVSSAGSLNHYFGLTMSTRFVQQERVDDKGNTQLGQVRDSKGSWVDMTYQFSGDDDVWIYVDDVLVADIGGIHDAAGVTINFHTGQVDFYNVVEDDGSMTNVNPSSHTTLKALFEAAEVESNFTGDTFAGNTNHTIKLFYLERGANDSNLYLKFNLESVPVSQIIKVDQSGAPIAGVGFDVYLANDGYSLVGGENAEPVASGTTDSAGKLQLLNDEGKAITFQDLHDNNTDDAGNLVSHFVVREQETPAGYRSGEDVHLDYTAPRDDTSGTPFSGYVTSDQTGMFRSGAYANAGVLIQSPVDIFDANTQDPTTPGSEIDDKMLQGGLIFAIVLHYDGEPTESDEALASGKWSAVSGTALDGYELTPINSIHDIATALKNQNTGYVFTAALSGSYETMIEELPGDITTYYNIILDRNESRKNVKYTVGYYFAEEVDSLSDITTETNIHRLYTEGNEQGNRWDRRFSINLKIPNIKNRLFVQKLDQNWNPISSDTTSAMSATFKLYKADDVEENNGKVTVKKDENGKYKAAYDTATTQPWLEAPDSQGVNAGKKLMQDGAVFPSGNSRQILEAGIYYLVESTAPGGAQGVTGDSGGNPPAGGYNVYTKVVVNSQGVYADAKDEGDDIRVRRGLGSLVRTMAQYATNDGVEETLKDVSINYQTASGYTEENGTGKFTWEDNPGAGVNKAAVNGSLYLSYSPDSSILQFGLSGLSHEGYDPSDPTKYHSYEDVTFMFDKGWANLHAYQNYNFNNYGAWTDVSSANKQDLTGKVENIDGLFSGTTTVQVRNTMTGRLLIDKTVINETNPHIEDDDAVYNVEVSLWLEDKDGNKTAPNITQLAAQVWTSKDGKDVQMSNKQGNVNYDAAVIDLVKFEKKEDADKGEVLTATLTTKKNWQYRIYTRNANDGLLTSGIHFSVKETPGSGDNWKLDSTVNRKDATFDDGIATGVIHATGNQIYRTTESTSVPWDNCVIITNKYFNDPTGLGIIKVDSSNKKPLEGVEFEIRLDDGDGEYDSAKDVKAEPLYTTKGLKTLITQPLATDSEGKIAAWGLEKSTTYWIVETKTLGGYSLLKDAIQVDVDEDGKVTFYGNGTKPSNVDGTFYTITIENTKVPELPQSGGIGNVPLYAAGMALAATGAMLAMGRTNRARQDNS